MSDDRKLRDDTLAALAEVGELGAGIIHESQNILTAALSFAQLGKRRTEDESARALFGDVETQLLRGIDMLSQFLVAARGARLSTRQPPVLVELPSVAAAVVRLVRPQYKLKRVSLDVTVEKATPPVMAIGSDLSQVLLNLLVNAMHATPEDGSVQVRVAADGSTAQIRVINTGAPIPENLCDRLFEPFFSTKEAGQGTGLGLSLGRRLAERNGGRLEVTHGRADGAEFVLSLPIASAALEDG